MQFLFLIMVPALNSIFSVAFLFTLSFTLSRIFSCKTQKFVRLSKFQKSPKNLAISTKKTVFGKCLEYRFLWDGCPQRTANAREKLKKEEPQLRELRVEVLDWLGWSKHNFTRCLDIYSSFSPFTGTC